MPSDGIIGGLSIVQEVELQRLVHQLQLSDEASGTLTSALVVPSSLDHMSLMMLYFPNEIDEQGTFAEIKDLVDGVVPHDEYIDEMLVMSISQIEETVQSKLASPFDLFGMRKIALVQLLILYLDVFTWSYKDMPCLDPSIVQHRFPISTHARLVKQKLRRLHPRWSLQDGKVKVCVDFRDLNKANPKNDFSLSHIDMLIDSTAGHSMLSFMDRFFWLKNAEATYQRVVSTLFHDMMHQDVEVYVDDMIVKSRDRVRSSSSFGEIL
ncbi:hypothetical protein CK203_079086 [Vitis vinifera]|uniref:Reverse transcriptase domain-containing protein n=1 Tax=Vitis vinifera TaxID=29760 RepID=A0A438BYJ9_VITVI|nr:hypothetical protein CK203_079086 [Vitis vinifera]